MMCSRFIGAIAVGLSLTLATAGQAAVRINELFVSPEDRLDGDEGDGREFIELKSDNPNESLAGLWLLEIDGVDHDEIGTVLNALNIGAAAPQTGANGLFLWRDSATELAPARHVETALFVQDFPAGDGLGLEDDVTYLLVRNFTGTVGDDLDTIGGGGFGDGVLDTTPWDSVLDAVGVVEIDTPGFSYAGAFGGSSLVTPFGPDALVRLASGEWFAFDSPLGEGDPAFVGPFTADGFDENDNMLENGTKLPAGIASQFALTPGSANSPVPEPASAALALGAIFAMAAAVRVRRS
jgi:hypothetical protein